MTDVFSCRTQTTKVVTRTRHYMAAKVWMENKTCTCYMFITWQKEVTCVINCHNKLKSDTVDDHSHYMQYTERR